MFLFIGSIFPGTICAQFPALDVVGDRDKVVVPFELIGGYIVLDVTIQNLFKLHFILDTGAQETTLFDRTIASALGYPLDEKIELIGADLSKTQEASIARNVPIRLAKGQSFTQDIIVLDEQQIDFKALLGHPIDGVIGSSFFKSIVLEINYKRGKIALHKPSFNSLKHDTLASSLKIIQGRPYIQCKVSMHGMDDTSLDLLYDTGAQFHAMLDMGKQDFVSQVKELEGGYIGQGLGGDMDGFVGVCSNFEVVGEAFWDLELFFHKSKNDSLFNLAKRDGSVGNAMFENRTVIIDFLNAKIRVKGRRRRQPDFGIDKSGIEVLQRGTKKAQFIVGRVFECSPAWKAGVRSGDELVRLGWIPNTFLSLERIRKQLAGEKGTWIHLVLKRNGRRKKIALKLDYCLRE